MSNTNPNRRRHAIGALLVAAALAAVAGGLLKPASAPAESGRETAAAAAPSYPRAGNILWRSVAARARPRASAPIVKVFPQFRKDFRPTTLLVLGQTRDAKGVIWLRVSVPIRPNGRTGWIRAAAVQSRPVRRTVVVDLSQRRLRVLERGKTRFGTRVAVGRPGMETPTGRFYVTAAFRPTERFFGVYAFETSAYSKLSEWPGGGLVGIHGTSMPWLLGQAVSHGCVRVSNAAALRLKRLAPPGTPVRIVA